ncbi:MAG: sigma-54-dependent Fis family transcriptional regulator [Candidatus Omnitrophica bacterium]|nr:sigma-54-dependent Fis family transcriptional regulator [Candidatus Omnitrophota bacterium]MCA9415946.1 sigma-54-dependent Fis family transcriptional regulator [Candidatus Omnitrophota bacterium]MCA9446323.1 sigma-54-dependent Fis family transcriptional regulator [Candidatus Omnitrophota bacterium]
MAKGAPPTIEVLLVEDDERFAKRMVKNLESEGFQVSWAPRGDEALETVKASSFSLMLADIKMPGMNGLELLEAIKRKPGVDPELPVVMLTSIDAVETAVESMQLGAADYIKKDAERGEIIQRVHRVLEDARVRREYRELRAQLSAQTEETGMVAKSPVMSAFLSEVRELAPSPVAILIQGETGAGKEVVAHEIHRISGRERDQWIPINCAALPEDDKFQSEVFGHERGAFTGASERRRGQFERAGEGTLFLDEVGELSLDSQSKLLRVLETGEYTRMGGSQVLNLRARVLLATNKDLRREVEEGNFRQDLFFRISVAPITVPPLRRRVEDIEPLCEVMMRDFANRYGKTPRPLSPEALARLKAYSWPGNVRELRNVIEGVLIRAKTGEVGADELRLQGPSVATEGRLVHLPPEGASLEEIERSAVEQALQMANHNQSAAARLLHISPDRLASRAKKFGLKQN